MIQGFAFLISARLSLTSHIQNLIKEKETEKINIRHNQKYISFEMQHLTENIKNPFATFGRKSYDLINQKDSYRYIRGTLECTCTCYNGDNVFVKYFLFDVTEALMSVSRAIIPSIILTNETVT